MGKQKKIGIVTIVDYLNYGNRLQNYAVQEVLKNLGYEAITIRNIPYDDRKFLTDGLSSKEQRQNKWKKYPFMRMFLREKKKARYLYSNIMHKAFYWKRKITYMFNTMTGKKSNHATLYQKREERFMEFSKRNIKESKFVLSEVKQNQKQLETFDFFVTGSDQVWNPNYKRANGIYFLQFAPKDKRIAFSASFGIGEYPKNRKLQLKRYLNDMQYISVREQRGKELVEENSDKKATVLIDPTLMLPKEKWEKLAQKPQCKFPEKYVLSFFLGGADEETHNYINRQAIALEAEVVSLADVKSEAYFVLNPAEFVYLIAHAQKVFTDSFHACVFSIIFHRNFQVFRRKKVADMFSRLETLLNTFGLEACIYDSDHDNSAMISVETYDSVDNILEKKREEAYSWLKDAFS